MKRTLPALAVSANLSGCAAPAFPLRRTGFPAAENAAGVNHWRNLPFGNGGGKRRRTPEKRRNDGRSGRIRQRF